MAYHLIDADPDRGLVLPAGEVRTGEHWLLETSLRVPLETAGLLRQRVGPFAADGESRAAGAERTTTTAWIDAG